MFCSFIIWTWICMFWTVRSNYRWLGMIIYRCGSHSFLKYRFLLLCWCSHESQLIFLANLRITHLFSLSDPSSRPFWGHFEKRLLSSAPKIRWRRWSRDFCGARWLLNILSISCLSIGIWGQCKQRWVLACVNGSYMA